MGLDVKICGLKTPETLTAALDNGASHVGFIFFAPSPRHITPVEAGRLRVAAQGRAKAVAVTVDAEDATLDVIVNTVRPDMLQLHGCETPQRVTTIKARYGLPIIKAFSICDANDLSAIPPYQGVADRFLFDTKRPQRSHLPGGNGISFDWSVLDALDTGIDYILSGGLHAGNIAEALRQTKASGIDISSGVEISSGKKDVCLIRDFFQAMSLATHASMI